MVKPGDPRGALHEALRALRASLAEASSPLSPTAAGAASPAPADAAIALAATVRAQLDDYLLPRLAKPDAPLLVAVGGPTGAGKSTLVNSLIRAPASASGVLRPTTRAPVLVCHPSDATWFRSGGVLGGLTRTSSPTDSPRHLHLVTAPALDAGCAFLDTPDLDSVVGQSREVADRLHAAADVWLFVVTAARYADAVPWDFLRTARQRGKVTAVVLCRVPPGAADEVLDHLSAMLAGNGLGDTPLFVVPETLVDGYGLVPEAEAAPLRRWFDSLAADQTIRADLVRHTLDGTAAALGPLLNDLAAAFEDQARLAEVLAERAGMAYGAARSSVERGIRDGALLRGQVTARWQEFVATGEWLRTPLAATGRRRDRLAVAVTRPSGAGVALIRALEAGLVALLRSVVIDAAEQTHEGWQAHATATPVPDRDGRSGTSPVVAVAGGDDQVSRLIRQWREDVLEMVRDELAAAPGRSRYAADATTASVMMAVCAPAEPPSATTRDGEVLAVLLDDDTMSGLATRARTDLLDRVGVLLDAEAARYLDRLAGSSPDVAAAGRLREMAVEVEQARAAAFVDDPAAQAGAGDPVAAGLPAGPAETDPAPAVDPAAREAGR